ncbi:MAG: hypothetical protein M3P33_04480 [bacterium]|nr:hypothetical protein [bacterium]
MGNFNNKRTYSDRNDRGRDKDRTMMHQATCSKCGKDCTVPFKPTGNRPLFCSNCFKTEGENTHFHNDDRNSRPREDRVMYDAVCDNCGNRCQIPFQARQGKEVYCSHCFEQIEKQGKGAFQKPQNNDQYESMNAKLDKILKLLTTNSPLPPPSPVVVPDKKPTIKRKASIKKK